MVEKIGVLVVSYGSRGVAILDSLLRSGEYDVEAYVADRQRNPFNIKFAKEHIAVSYTHLTLPTKRIV